MQPDDVVLTPNWSWHGHGNDGASTPIGSISSMCRWCQFEPMFFEPFPGDYWEAGAASETSPMRFGWEETRRRLDAAPSSTEITLGDRALDTMAFSMIRLRGGDATPVRRTSANNLYAVVAGSGTSTIDGERFACQRGDVIAAPAWQPHTRAAVEDAVLFRVSDELVMSQLGFFRPPTERHCPAGSVRLQRGATGRRFGCPRAWLASARARCKKSDAAAGQ